jgi:hypothetical protein
MRTIADEGAARLGLAMPRSGRAGQIRRVGWAW